MISNMLSYRYGPIFLLIFFMLPSCRDPHKENLGMKPLTALIDYYGSAHGITLRVKKLDVHDCKIFDKRSPRLFKRFRQRPPIWPIQLSITNDTNKLIALKPSDIDLPLLPYKQVAARLGNSSFTQIFGAVASSVLVSSFLVVVTLLAISGTFFVALATGSLGIAAPFALLSGSGILAIPTFLVLGPPILSTVRGVQTTQYNNLIRQRVKQATLQKSWVIEPGKSTDAIIFVSKPNYRSSFQVRVPNPENAYEKISFEVTIPSSAHALSMQ